MTLGDIIKKYRRENDMSMDAFAKKSGISKAYISLLEKNQHPKTGKTIAPSIQCIKQAADGMSIDFNLLFSQLDGTVSLIEDKPAVLALPQSIPSQIEKTYGADMRELVETAAALDPSDRRELIGTAKYLTRSEKYRKEEAGSAG